MRRIEGQVFRDTLRIAGAEWNGAVIRGNLFIGQREQGLLISDVSGLRIEDNRFTGMRRNAIKLKTRQREGSRDILIQNNLFEETPATAILVGPPNRGVRILGNRFVNVAWDRSGNKQHAIYVKAPGTLVEGNSIDGVKGAHGISMRSAGVVRGNRVADAREAGIKYYSSARDIGDGRLLIENNIVTGCGKAGIAFDRGKGRLIRRAVVRFNTLVENRTAVRLHPGMEDMAYEIYGNIFAEPGHRFLSLESKPPRMLLESNVRQTGTAGFRAPEAGDFRLTADAAARYRVDMQAGDAMGPPATDFAGRPFGEPPYDAGALQFQTPSPPKTKP